MLDLKTLEQKLDRALENETKESLTNWLLNKRLKTVLYNMGIGEVSELNAQHSSFFSCQINKDITPKETYIYNPYDKDAA